MRRLLNSSLLLVLLLFIGSCASDVSDLSALTQDQEVGGFIVQNLYLDGKGQPMGARFLGQESGFTVDLLQIQSVPQGFMWVKTKPLTDQGEAHACEHLLLGKGTVGRYVANLEGMTLGSSTAWTSQLNTVYHFNTLAGVDAFYTTLEARLNALINPSFTDEEIRREVCHIGVAENPDGSFFLEEKGTVYSEMISAYEGSGYPLWNALGNLIYGEDHPQANSSGGSPTAMRSMTAQDMWDFHKENYRPANMGIIASLPKDVAPGDFLSKLADIIHRVHPEPDSSEFPGLLTRDLPPISPLDVPGTIVIGPYSAESAEQPGEIVYSWTPDLDLNLQQMVTADLFLETFAGGPGTIIYDTFVNSETRQMDLGASGVFGYRDDAIGSPIQFSFSGLNNENISEAKIQEIRGLMIDKIREVHSWADGSEELSEFNDRASSTLIAKGKQLNRALNSPPMFGFRRGSAGVWEDLLALLELEDSFEKSLLFVDNISELEKQIETGNNFWREIINQCHLLESLPYASAVYPSTDMLAQAELEKNNRLAAKLAEFKVHYVKSDASEAIAAYKAEFDSTTAELEALAANDVMPRFVDSPPMTMDDQLDYTVTNLPAGPVMVASTFDNMTTQNLGVAFNLNVLPEGHLHVLPLLPALMTQAGVMLDGERVDYVSMQQRLQREVTRFNAFFGANETTGRIELTVNGVSSNEQEMKALLQWMTASLNTPLADTENLPRLHDIIDQALNRLRTRMQGSPERWVNDPPAAWRMQSNPLFLATRSFITQAHYYHRLGWLLREPGTDVAAATLTELLNDLANSGATADRDGLIALLDSPPAVSAGADCGELADRVIASLRACLPEIPDENLIADWAYLCTEIKSDLLAPPTQTLQLLNDCLTIIRNSNNARFYLTSSTVDRQLWMPGIEDFAASLNSSPIEPAVYATNERIFERLQSRADLDKCPPFAGLINKGTRNGVLVFRAKAADTWDTSTDAVLNSLAGKLYGGGGGHGLFMRTWAAGLAYSNGYGYRDGPGTVTYYAERCPDVAQTMRFVVDVIKDAEPDEGLLEYAIAGAFNARSAGPYENRGAAIAADLADGFGPEVIREYRQKILEVRDHPNLLAELKQHMPEAYGKVLIGYGPPVTESEKPAFFLVGPESQFTSLQEYINAVEGPAEVHRLYARDFWIVN